MKLDDRIPHIVLAPGKGLKCHCGQPASRFVLCPRCREIVASCGCHGMTADQDRDNHCKGK
jgi:hypothetical protein